MIFSTYNALNGRPMKKILLTLVLLCQTNHVFAYSENTSREKIESLNTTFVLQSNNFYSELDKMNNLAQDSNADPNHMYTLYITTSQSLCTAALTIEKTKNLIEENPQIIRKILTEDNISGINSTSSAFKKFLKEFGLDNQQCKGMMTHTYNSIANI